MIKLLRADFSRLWKTKVLWALMLAAFAMGVGNIFYLPDNWEEQTAHTLLQNGMHYMIFASVFAPLFLGTDYVCGAMRSKLAVGSKRIDIYFSEFLTVSAGSLLISICEIVPMIFKVSVFGKTFGMEAGEFAFGMFTIFCALEAAIGIFTLIGMLITSKPISVVLSILIGIRSISTGALIINVLDIPEFIEDSDDPNAEPIRSDNYIDGALRDVLITANDILPGGQLVQLQSGETHNEKALPLYSLGILAVSTAAGVAVFRRKDLK